MNFFYPFRKVVREWTGRLPHTPKGGGYMVHELECGHKVTTKMSYGYKNKMRCRECGLSAPSA